MEPAPTRGRYRPSGAVPQSNSLMPQDDGRKHKERMGGAVPSSTSEMSVAAGRLRFEETPPISIPQPTSHRVHAAAEDPFTLSPPSSPPAKQPVVRPLNLRSSPETMFTIDIVPINSSHHGAKEPEKGRSHVGETKRIKKVGAIAAELLGDDDLFEHSPRGGRGEPVVRSHSAPGVAMKRQTHTQDDEAVVRAESMRRRSMSGNLPKLVHQTSLFIKPPPKPEELSPKAHSESPRARELISSPGRMSSGSPSSTPHLVRQPSEGSKREKEDGVKFGSPRTWLNLVRKGESPTTAIKSPSRDRLSTGVESKIEIQKTVIKKHEVRDRLVVVLKQHYEKLLLISTILGPKSIRDLLKATIETRVKYLCEQSLDFVGDDEQHRKHFEDKLDDVMRWVAGSKGLVESILPAVRKVYEELEQLSKVHLFEPKVNTSVARLRIMLNNMLNNHHQTVYREHYPYGETCSFLANFLFYLSVGLKDPDWDEVFVKIFPIPKKGEFNDFVENLSYWRPEERDVVETAKRKEWTKEHIEKIRYKLAALERIPKRKFIVRESDFILSETTKKQPLLESHPRNLVRFISGTPGTPVDLKEIRIISHVPKPDTRTYHEVEFVVPLDNIDQDDPAIPDHEYASPYKSPGHKSMVEVDACNATMNFTETTEIPPFVPKIAGQILEISLISKLPFHDVCVALINEFYAGRTTSQPFLLRHPLSERAMYVTRDVNWDKIVVLASALDEPSRKELLLALLEFVYWADVERVEVTTRVISDYWSVEPPKNPVPTEKVYRRNNAIVERYYVFNYRLIRYLYRAGIDFSLTVPDMKKMARIIAQSDSVDARLEFIYQRYVTDIVPFFFDPDPAIHPEHQTLILNNYISTQLAGYRNTDNSSLATEKEIIFILLFATAYQLKDSRPRKAALPPEEVLSLLRQRLFIHTQGSFDPALERNFSHFLKSLHGLARDANENEMLLQFYKRLIEKRIPSLKDLLQFDNSTENSDGAEDQTGQWLRLLLTLCAKDIRSDEEYQALCARLSHKIFLKILNPAVEKLFNDFLEATKLFLPEGDPNACNQYYQQAYREVASFETIPPFGQLQQMLPTVIFTLLHQSLKGNEEIREKVGKTSLDAVRRELLTNTKHALSTFITRLALCSNYVDEVNFFKKFNPIYELLFWGTNSSFSLPTDVVLKGAHAGLFTPPIFTRKEHGTAIEIRVYPYGQFIKKRVTLPGEAGRPGEAFWSTHFVRLIDQGRLQRQVGQGCQRVFATTIQRVPIHIYPILNPDSKEEVGNQCIIRDKHLMVLVGQYKAWRRVDEPYLTGEFRFLKERRLIGHTHFTENARSFQYPTEKKKKPVPIDWEEVILPIFDNPKTTPNVQFTNSIPGTPKAF